MLIKRYGIFELVDTEGVSNSTTYMYSIMRPERNKTGGIIAFNSMEEAQDEIKNLPSSAYVILPVIIKDDTEEDEQDVQDELPTSNDDKKNKEV